ncbi:MAG: LutC/YkgG family protein [Bryobacteraceae bacterium]
MNRAKDEILDRIRRAINDVSTSCTSDYAAIAREYQRSANLDQGSRMNLFAERLHDYGAVVYRGSHVHLPETIARALAVRSKRKLLIPKNVPQEWLPPTFEFVRDDGLSYEAIDQSEGVLTGCAVAVALTGTIVLRHSSGEGRRALTLIPDYHLCVVLADQIVETVPEGIRRAAGFGRVPITTLSGPSATSDIEMTRIKGVHGPRTLDVILVVS